MSLKDAIKARKTGSDAVPSVLNALLPGIVSKFNSEVAPKLLSRLPTETLPESPRAASSFRTRVSLLVEYSFIELLSEYLSKTSPGLNVTFNTTNEFADFFIRNNRWDVELRVDIKTLHDLSDEASARYTALQQSINHQDDYLLYLAWQWRELDYSGVNVIIPAVIGSVFIPCIEVAQERDRHRLLSGGSFDRKGYPLTSSGLRDTNFGKLNRLVHKQRRGASDLSPRLRQLLGLLNYQVAARAGMPAEMHEVESLAESA
ncbi:hypothetical protein [Arthrobacter yangruifuii]|uniref:hypothetical protein n=1 Tax=Arthrobacter yangruifuii TaxID=2606616 RepID=UPI0011B70884|nr:hypothetical protein [Arthrobacter yangruifuii]